MPIRMTDDPVDPNQRDDDGGGGRRGPNFPGRGGGLGALLPMILGLMKGKKGIFLLLILAAGAFFLFKGGYNLNQLAKLATGGMLDPKEFEKAKIYEPLADDPSRPALPESANLQRFAPAVGNQGEQGSCVAWSSAYAARTILESARTGSDGDNLKFSPAFLYNEIGLEGCQGSYIIRAMEFMTKQGSVPYNDFQYDDQDCSRQPDQRLMSDAQQFKMHGFNRFSLGDRNDVIDMHAVKENLAQGAPVVIGMMVGQSFMQSMKGQDVWEPESGDENMMGFGGHAMCVVGYDDNKYGGAFLLMNSWGPEWGNNGFAWVHYSDFNFYVREAYGTSYTLFPYPAKEDPTKTRYSAFCGITGYRLFPKDKSIMPDSIGTRDVMAIVVSKEELNWHEINQKISANPQLDYGARLNAALGNKLARNVRFQSSGKGTMQFNAGSDNSIAVACIVEIDKR